MTANNNNAYLKLDYKYNGINQTLAKLLSTTKQYKCTFVHMRTQYEINSGSKKLIQLLQIF